MGSSKYIIPTNPMSDTEKVVHFLVWRHENRPGVRISPQEIVCAVRNLKKIPPKDHSEVRKLKSRYGHISKMLRERHELGWDTNEDGVRILDQPGEIIAVELSNQVKGLAAKQRRVKATADLAYRKRDLIEDTREGRNQRKYLSLVRSTVENMRLPSAQEVAGLLVPHEDEDD
ncbi:MAG TPA: hypothetical protein VIE65_02090 [Methylobacter sp.]|jgi:hypothetical protein